ncbi:uncharacterized protein A4U43_C01F20190 [Asparagus officinalis]|uniref:KIB1-4 beta-propeller domain-containing protein n=1 Tax=Asparagus officinalis TaxID=4686 RepID=A0A5P1FVA9_ASPOF|nr:uncharacterized protein A4U43_C01F20190 [Asparagus officinalis]
MEIGSRAVPPLDATFRLSMGYWYSESNSNDCIFFSVEEKRYYELNIHVDKRSTCWGSSEGWLMMAHPLTRKFLVNPISGEKVRLPPQNILPIKKFIVSTSPMSSTSARVAVLHAHESRISTCLLGDKSWTNMNAEKSSKYDRYRYRDILIEEGGRGDCLAQEELDNSMVEEKTFLLKFKNEIFMSVVTCTKERRLLLKCYIYKNIDKHWIPCNNMGDLTMFISTECYKIVVSNEESIFRRNSVYYIDSGMRKLFEFCLDDGSSIDLKDFEDFYPRMWFFPST